ncbi:MAG TPA: glutamyl-tRNA reductase [candidate division Zixibacteria bacterium]|nr:glutamyl-tRNA reductase [candidate division Zixibacteria bacterium]
MELGIIGTSIWQQNMRLLETLTIDREGKLDRLVQLKAALGVDELIYLSTCNRVEFIFASRENGSTARVLHRLIDFFFAGGRDISFFPNDFYQYSGRDAVRHLFRTVASLDSLVVGETQITGQFKEAAREATEAGLSGTLLDVLTKEALAVAKRVRTETSLGDGAVSMASLAYSELEAALGDRRERPTVALVGAGAMTSKMARYIAKAGLAELVFVNRTADKAASLAREFGGRGMGLAEFLTTPPPVDAILSATASPAFVFTHEHLEKLSAGRPPVLCIDLAIPQDFSPEFGRDPRAVLVDIPALKTREQRNLRRKFVESSRANEIVGEAVQAFLRNRLEVSMKPILRDSYEQSLELANRALDDFFEKKLCELSREQKEHLRTLVIKLIGHSSFGPARLLSNHLVDLQDQFLFDMLGESRKEAV